MNIKNSKKIVPATVFAAIIVLLAFAVMSTTATQDKLVTTFDSKEGNLGDVVDVRIDVTNVDATAQKVNVVDRLPAEFTYIPKTFTVNDNAVNPDVNERENIISYDIDEIGIGTYNIKFNVKVTEAYWDDVTVTNRVDGTWFDANAKVIKRISDTARFNIKEFTYLYEKVKGEMKVKTGKVATWDITMGVKNPFDHTMTDPKITENFAGNLKIDKVTVGAAGKVGATTTTYTFVYDNYGTKEATVDIFQDDINEPVVDDWPLEDCLESGGVNICWMGMTHAAHFAWNIREVKEITIVVSTDTNPAGYQEYTSPGKYALNSGAKLTFIAEDSMQISQVTAPTKVTAVKVL